jgi:hypothetical protein
MSAMKQFARVLIVLALPAATARADENCAACHSTAGWQGARFAHERTGFVLKGAHERVRCASCHQAGLDRPVPKVCAGCHRDAHGGELGARCEGCHEETGWRPAKFGADAHRKTRFPLTGRHALIPCQECHPDVRDRSFARAIVECVACHRQDYDRTASLSVDHRAAGFSTDCRQCHDPFRFSPARYAAHDVCFQLRGGPHGGIRCLSCHTSLAGVVADGTCSTNNAACSSCHTHACSRTDRQHEGVPGYQCRDRKCYECHRFSK